MGYIISKKGFYFYIELIVVILLVTLIWTQFPVSQQSYLDLSAQEDMKYLGYTALKSLDYANILPRLINQTNFTRSNFTKLDLFIKNALPTTVLATVEYVVNESTCHNASGSMGSCGVNNTVPDTTAVMYTFTNTSSEPVSIKLYLKNVFAGRL